MSQSSSTTQQDESARTRIEDIQAVGEVLNEEHLCLISGGMTSEGTRTMYCGIPDALA
jgi:hypothetical protein